MAIPTYVESLNGYEGNLPFQPDPMITLDANDIRVTGDTGDTIKTKMQALANNMRILELDPIGSTGQYKIRIGGYRLVTTNE